MCFLIKKRTDLCVYVFMYLLNVLISLQSPWEFFNRFFLNFILSLNKNRKERNLFQIIPIYFKFIPKLAIVFVAIKRYRPKLNFFCRHPLIAARGIYVVCTDFFHKLFVGVYPPHTR